MKRNNDLPLNDFDPSDMIQNLDIRLLRHLSISVLEEIVPKCDVIEKACDALSRAFCISLVSARLILLKIGYHPDRVLIPEGYTFERLSRLLGPIDRLDRSLKAFKWVAGITCPLCGLCGKYRSGYEFEHQMRCFNGCDPAPIWIPGDVYSVILKAK
jgi:hypothetical protein